MLLLTDIQTKNINEIEKKIKEGKINPRDAKIKLAFEIVKFFHGEEKAEKAKEEFERVFSKKETPKDMPVVKIDTNKINLVELLVNNKILPSKSEARRLIEQRAVEINGEKIKNWKEEIEIKKEAVLKIGKKRFVRIRAKNK